MQFVVFALFVVLAMANAFAPIGRASNAAIKMASAWDPPFPGFPKPFSGDFIKSSKKGTLSIPGSGASASTGSSFASSSSKKSFVQPGFKSVAPTKGTKPDVKVSKKFGKDMTWGGRPDPTPEMIVAGASVPFASEGYTPKASDSAGGFLEAPWRYNLRK